MAEAIPGTKGLSVGNVISVTIGCIIGVLIYIFLIAGLITG